MYTIIQDFLQRINIRLSPSVFIYFCMILLIPILIINTFGASSRVSSVFVINYADASTNYANVSAQNDSLHVNFGRIYASSKGKRYYIEGLCEGRVSAKNKVYYKSEAEALKSGKTKASSC